MSRPSSQSDAAVCPAASQYTVTCLVFTYANSGNKADTAAATPPQRLLPNIPTHVSNSQTKLQINAFKITVHTLLNALPKSMRELFRFCSKPFIEK